MVELVAVWGVQPTMSKTLDVLLQWFARGKRRLRNSGGTTNASTWGRKANTQLLADGTLPCQRHVHRNATQEDGGSTAGQRSPSDVGKPEFSG